MPDLVCTGAVMECSFGTLPATFRASAVTVSAPAPAGAVTDTGTANVPPFGNCISENNPQVKAASEVAGGPVPQPCLPVLMGNWTGGSARVKVGASAALDSACRCRCAWDGIITVTSAGQARVTLG